MKTGQVGTKSREKQAVRSVLVILALSFLSSQLHAQVSTDYTITTSDGVKLESTLVLPDSGAPAAGFPTILLIHGYGGKKSEWTGVDAYLVSLGYGCFMYSVRGQGNSGGLSTTMGPREKQDLLEVIQFLRTLPGVDSNSVAVAGGSQGGIHAWMAATSRMPGVKVIATLIGPPSFSLDLVPAGCIKQQLWAEVNLGSVRYDPVRDHLRDFVIADSYDSVYAYVASRDLQPLLDSVSIPVIQSLGWADVLFPVNGGINAMKRLSTRGLPIWSYFGTNGHGELNLAEYYYVVTGLIASWFNKWLKGIPLENAESPMVVYADDRITWPHHESQGWPPPTAGSLRLYLSGSMLQTTPPVHPGVGSFTLSYDSSYTPAQGWSDGYNGTGFTNAFRSSAARFVSNPVADTVEVTGIPRAVLQVQSDALRFQSNLRIFDLAPADTGLVWTLITRGAHGIRLNNPGMNVESEIECQALSHLVMPGHRIGIEVTSLDMYNTTRPHIIPYFRSSSSTVSSSPASLSYIDLPIVGTATLTSVVARNDLVPSAATLYQNYPNPFNPSTTLRFSVAVSQHVRLEVVNILGQTVAVLLDGVVQRGEHTVGFKANSLASGVYFCRLIGENVVSEMKMVLVR
jgi:predicted acyl esterase